MNLKQFTRRIIVLLLNSQVKQLLARNTSMRVIGVVGSYGKTSTKAAIAQTLTAAGLRVRWQEGNYNDFVTVPLVFFGTDLPALFNPFAWLKCLIKHARIIRRPYPYDIVLIELGIDGVDQMRQFGRYLHLDIAVVTSIGPEHMEFFKDVNQVAEEELSVAEFSAKLIVNTDLVDAKYLSDLTFTGYDLSKQGQQTEDVSQYSAQAALTVGRTLGISEDILEKAAGTIHPMPGRMTELAGLNGSVIIDDTYNASPEACSKALKYLYARPEPHKIMLLGNMNELGAHSASAHTALGEECTPELDLLVTLGPDANEYLAPAAEKNGVKVIRCVTPYEAADHLKDFLTKDSVLLAKGSQNKVYAEEAIKLLLANRDDEKSLVRQSSSWLAKKRQAFESE